MKAIKTKYGSYTFRSRTEARWAAFFDYLKLDWIYEPEGFVLEEYGCYLPDFYIKDFGYVEIKGAAEQLSQETVDKLAYLSQKIGQIPDRICERTLLIIGLPNVAKYEAVVFWHGMGDSCDFKYIKNETYLHLHDSKELIKIYRRDETAFRELQKDAPLDAFKFALAQKFGERGQDEA